MTHQTMLELSDGWDVTTPLGDGVVLIITTPSYLGNSTLYVRLNDSGQLKHFDSNDVVLHGSPTYGQARVPKKLPWEIEKEEPTRTPFSPAEVFGTPDNEWEYGTCGWLSAEGRFRARRHKIDKRLEHETGDVQNQWITLDKQYGGTFIPDTVA